MSIEIPMHHHGVSKIVQGAVAKNGNVYLPLQLAGKRWKAGAFQNHGAHIGILIEKVDAMTDELIGRLVIVSLRSLRTPICHPEIDKLTADIVIAGAFDHIVAAQLNPH